MSFSFAFPSSVLVLGRVAGCVAALQPFTWQHIFVPLLPAKMLSYVCAPYPFLIGVHASLLPQLLAPDSEYPMNEALVVDLDKGAVFMAGGSEDAFEGGGAGALPWKGLVNAPKAVRRGADKVGRRWWVKGDGRGQATYLFGHRVGECMTERMH